MTTTLPEFIASLEPAFSLRGSAAPSQKELAARIRKELAAAVKAGVIQAGTEFSVRCSWATHSRKIDVEITRWNGAVFGDSYTEACLESYAAGSAPFWPGRNVERYAPAFVAAVETAKKIADRHNFDESDTMSDYFHVGYYLSCDGGPVESAATVGLRCEADPAFAAKRAAGVAAAAALPKNLVKYLAPDGVESASDYTLEQLLKWGERAKAGPVVHVKGRGWTVQRAA